MNPVWSVVSSMTAGRVFTRRAATPGRVFLTFDDGPDPQHTPPLLDLLARYDARATFFMLGASVERYPALVRDVLARGHTLGNHSFSHPSFLAIPASRQIEEIERTDALLAAVDGRARHLFRPPRGRPGLNTLSLCLRRRQRIALWTHDSRDFERDTAEVIAALRGTALAAGDILLFHDDGAVAREALEVLLPEWRQHGLESGAL